MSATAITTTAAPTATETSYDELLKYYGLSAADVLRLKNDDVTVLQLMTEQLVPIALNMYDARELLSIPHISSEEIELFALADLGSEIDEAEQ